MGYTRLPAKRNADVARRHADLIVALRKVGIDADEIASGVKKLLTATKSIRTRDPDTKRSVHCLVPDTTALRAGIELSLEIMGLRKPQTDSGETSPESKLATVDAVVALTIEKRVAGWDKEQIATWFTTEEGVAAVNGKVQGMIRSRRVVVVKDDEDEFADSDDVEDVL